MPHRPTNFRSTVVKPFYIEKVPEEPNSTQQEEQTQEQVVQRSTRTENQEPRPEAENPESLDIPDQTSQKEPESNRTTEPEPPKNNIPEEIEYDSDTIVVQMPERRPRGRPPKKRPNFIPEVGVYLNDIEDIDDQFMSAI